MQLILLSVVTSLLAGLVALFGPKADADYLAAKADVGATQALSYKQALVTYLASNPNFTGQISNGSITLPAGLVWQSGWTNYVTNGVLYVYEPTPSKTAGLLDSLYQKTQGSMLVGTVRSGNYLSHRGGSTGSLPAPMNALSDGSILMIGR